VETLSVLWTNWVPVLGATLSRSMEYSCDRVAQALTGQTGADAMMAGTVGRHLYRYVDVHDYVVNIRRDRGVLAKVAYAFVNLLADHPVIDRRITALLCPSQSIGSLIGRITSKQR